MSHRNIDTEPNLVVCLHASASSARQWHGLTAELAGSVDVLAPTLVGYGDAAPFDETASFGFDSEIDAVVDQIGAGWRDAVTRIHLVGHSYGAAAAVHFAHRFPERTASLTLFEPAMFRLLADEERWCREFREICLVGNYVRSKVGRRFGKKKAARRFMEYWSGKGVWQFLPADRRQRFAQAMPKVAAEFEAIKSSPIQRRDLEKLEMPVRLICGAATRAPARAVSKVLAAVLPNVELIVLDNAAHMAPVTAPDRVNPLIVEHIGRYLPASIRAAA